MPSNTYNKKVVKIELDSTDKDRNDNAITNSAMSKVNKLQANQILTSILGCNSTDHNDINSSGK